MARKLSPKGWTSVNWRPSTLHQPRLSQASPRTIKRPYHKALLHINHWCSISYILVSSAVHFHKRRKGGICTMNQAPPVPLASAFAFWLRGCHRAFLFSRACFGLRLSYISPCNLVVQHGIKAAVDGGSG
jgi:hypothetical protein